MTDRELLKAAAKAAGYWCSEFNCPDKLPRPEWNPLTNDGDALRLVAVLNIDIEMGLCYCEATWVDMAKSETHRFMEDWGAGPTRLDVRLAKIRRAIVRAAVAAGHHQ